ncbi:MAG: T9SS type A sorting domain-containing protein [Bacteroidota bacterium]
MKKATALIMVLLCLSTLTCYVSYSQCVPNTSFSGAGIYPDTLPDATAGIPYDEDVTFVMLTDTLGLTIYDYQITNISGLPIGLSWQCNNIQSGCVYDPAVSLYGCVKIFGSPVVPGTFTFTVTVVADVQLAGAQTINFDRPLTVLPANVSNPGFAMTNNVGCAPLTVSFTNNNPGQASYAWDFGNGLQSNVENPPSQTYTTPGTYVVTQTVTPNIIPDFYLTNITVTGIPNNYGGPIDDPDPYFLLYNPSGAQIYDSRPALNGVFPPYSWNTPNILLSNGNYTVHVWDEDGGLFGGDDDLGAISFAGNGNSGTATGTVGGASGTLVVNYTIFQTPIVPLTATDTIHVFATPSIPSITPAGPTVICDGDAIDLTSSDSLNNVQWYESGGLIVGANNHVFVPTSSGSFSVVATSPEGCTASSATSSVTINPLPTKPTFFINGNTFTTGVTGLSLQWYLNGNPIPNATNSSYTAQVGGTYLLCGVDANGCQNCSDPLIFSGVGLAEQSGLNFDVYPNPGNGVFSIVFADQMNFEKVAFAIYDLSGRIVFEEHKAYERTERLETNLNPGTYTLEIIVDDYSTKKKIIVFK